MTETQFAFVILAIIGAGFATSVGIAKVFDRLTSIQEQLQILPEISDRLKAIHEALKSPPRR